MDQYLADVHRRGLEADVAESQDGRRNAPATVIDLERLEAHARTLFLHRFVEAIRKAREQHGRFLYLRSGDELAIAAAGDGSAELLEQIAVAQEPQPPPTA